MGTMPRESKVIFKGSGDVVREDIVSVTRSESASVNFYRF